VGRVSKRFPDSWTLTLRSSARNKHLAAVRPAVLVQQAQSPHPPTQAYRKRAKDQQGVHGGGVPPHRLARIRRVTHGTV